MLVTDGWLPSYSIEKIIMQIRLQLCDMDRPARLLLNGPAAASDYSVGEAIDAYKRAASSHGWTVSADLNHIISGLTKGA
jgi:ubiquitin-conjugating enzyme E2 Q